MPLTTLTVSWNRRKGREVYEEVVRRGIMVHSSVQNRMLVHPTDEGKKQYLPKVRFTIYGELRRLKRDERLAKDPEWFEWVD